MKMCYLAICAGILFAGARCVAGEPDPPEGKFLIKLEPQDLDTADLSITYKISGSFGGYSGPFVPPDPHVRQYTLDTTFQGKNATALKAMIYRPGYGFHLIDIPSLKDFSKRFVVASLEPLPAIPLKCR